MTAKREETPRRKGARTMADIPPEVLKALNEGRTETVNLVEWLAVDPVALLRNAARDVGLDAHLSALMATVEPLAAEGVTARTRGVGQALHDVLADLDEGEQTFERLATHGSDMVRAWAAYALRADNSIDLKERIHRTHRFASDPCMSVRECAWESLRPHIEADLVRAIQLLERWVHEADPAVRRCAIEGTRPCGVWTKHIAALKEKPEIGLPLLEQCRSDSSDYVRRAVANWLNDASKSQPKWVKEIGARWKRESPTEETAWIVNHALRTLRKKAKG
jgi:3-methyladenine DNA glycosylase AlkC